MNEQEHWENVYLNNQPEKMGWYRPELETSLNWIKEFQPDRDARIIDVGGGASTLVDGLLAEGYSSITVADLSKTALELTRKRLSEKADAVTWLAGDITVLELPSSAYHLWHDRAAFHFLTTEDERQKYLDQLKKALKPSGHLIMATFSPEAPPRCSGLKVERYTPYRLEGVLGPEFILKRDIKELHVTPGGVEHMYLYCCFQRTG